MLVDRHPHSFPTRRSSDLESGRTLAKPGWRLFKTLGRAADGRRAAERISVAVGDEPGQWPARTDYECLHCLFSASRSEEHTSELQSPVHLVCRLLLEKKNR